MAATQRRTALVLGGTSGLGLAIATAMADEGWATAIVGHQQERLHTAAAHKAFRHRPSTAILADLDTDIGCKSAVDTAVAAFGGLDVLIVNNGGPPPGDFADLDGAAWQRGVDRTLLSAVRAIDAALPSLRKGFHPRIVLLTSITTIRPRPRLTLSNALRRAVEGLARSLAVELAPQGITVNCVAPGFTATERLEHLFADAAKAKGTTAAQERAETIAQIPLGRLCTPAEVAAAVLWLASPAADAVTGQTLAVDGGWSASG